jgi:hypothetical protein
MDLTSPGFWAAIGAAAIAAFLAHRVLAARRRGEPGSFRWWLRRPNAVEDSPAASVNRVGSLRALRRA